MEELFKPQELYSKKALRTVYDRLAHASIMRLNQASMDKVKKTTCPVLTMLHFCVAIYKFLIAIISTWLYVTVILKHFVTALFPLAFFVKWFSDKEALGKSIVVTDTSGLSISALKAKCLVLRRSVGIL